MKRFSSGQALDRRKRSAFSIRVADVMALVSGKRSIERGNELALEAGGDVRRRLPLTVEHLIGPWSPLA